MSCTTSENWTHMGLCDFVKVYDDGVVSTLLLHIPIDVSLHCIIFPVLAVSLIVALSVVAAVLLCGICIGFICFRKWVRWLYCRSHLWNNIPYNTLPPVACFFLKCIYLSILQKGQRAKTTWSTVGEPAAVPVSARTCLASDNISSRNHTRDQIWSTNARTSAAKAWTSTPHLAAASPPARHRDLHRKPRVLPGYLAHNVLPGDWEYWNYVIWGRRTTWP